jgi:hypothetical protein
VSAAIAAGGLLVLGGRRDRADEHHQDEGEWSLHGRDPLLMR